MSQFEKWLNIWTHNSERIIQWALLAILIMSGYLIARFLLSKKESSEGSSPELSGALQKIMEQTAKLEALSLDKLGAAGVANVDAQVQTLKTELAARETEISKLKESGGAGSGKAAEEAMALSARIKELEGKLAEYEILEDDIADLSLYKEENTRLRGELEALKGGGAAPAAAAAPASAAAVSVAATAEAVPGDDIVAEFAQAVENDPTLMAPPATIEVRDTGDPMADFESAVKAEKAAIAPAAPAPAAAPAAPTAPKPAAQAAAPASSAAPAAEAPAAQNEADDLFAEFAAAADTPEEGAEGGLDTDKMMAEMAALVSMEPASDNALEESIDTEKMALEASNFNKS